MGMGCESSRVCESICLEPAICPFGAPNGPKLQKTPSFTLQPLPDTWVRPPPYGHCVRHPRCAQAACVARVRGVQLVGLIPICADPNVDLEGHGKFSGSRHVVPELPHNGF